MDWVPQIRCALQGVHDSIEQLPIAQGMVKGTVTRTEYVALLGQLRTLHASLEAALVELEHYPELITPEVFRTEVIEQDMAALGAGEPAVLSTWSVTSTLLSRIEQHRQEQPLRLLGCLYVLEGSRMGSLFLWEPLSKALGVAPQPGQGLDYHMNGMFTRPKQWSAFKQKLDASLAEHDDREQVIAGAVEMMEGLHHIYAAASPPAE